MTTNTDGDEELADELTEQLEANFGNMNVYASGTDAEEVRESFELAWEKMTETMSDVNDMKSEEDDSERSGPSSFG